LIDIAIKKDDPSVCYAWEAWVEKNDGQLQSRTVQRQKRTDLEARSVATAAGKVQSSSVEGNEHSTASSRTSKYFGKTAIIATYCFNEESP
jgi:hypothetical protein